MTVRIAKPPVNIREKLAEMERPIGLNGQALLATSTPQEAFDLLGAGRRNLLINGDFKISQRGDYSSATAASNSTYYLDRWKTDVSGPSATIQRQTVTLPNGTQTYSAKLAATSTAANSYLQLQQFVELFPYIQGRTVTMSAWVRSNRQARLRIESTSGNYDGLTAHSGSGNWEYITQTLTLGTGLSLLKFGVIFWNSSGGTTGTDTGAGINSGDYIEFANYQVEFGKVATPFEYRSYGQELALCQRYYQIITTGNGFTRVVSGPSKNWIYGQPMIQMRSAPSVSADITGTNANRTYIFDDGQTGHTVNSGQNLVLSDAGANTNSSYYVSFQSSIVGYSGIRQPLAMTTGVIFLSSEL